jgi:uncharacterized protein
MIAITAFVVGLVFGAGFDCSKATHPVEVRICSDSVLSALDDSLAVAWKSTLSVFGSAQQKALRREQKEWMADLRREAPEVPALRQAWRHRLRELELKRSTTDLRMLQAALATVGTVRLENSGPCGYMDFETGEPVMSTASDLLELSSASGSGGLRFYLTAGMNQPQCHSCGLESEVPITKKARRSWANTEADDKASGALSITPDSIVLEIHDHNQFHHCGIGASLGPTYTFHRHTLRLAPP